MNKLDYIKIENFPSLSNTINHSPLKTWGSLERELISGLGQGRYNVFLEHVVPEGNEGPENDGNLLKGLKNQRDVEGLPLAQWRTI